MPVAGTGLLAVTLLVGQGDLKSGVSTWVARHQKEIVGELLELLAIPNVAADQPNIRRNAEHLRDDARPSWVCCRDFSRPPATRSSTAP